MTVAGHLQQVGPDGLDPVVVGQPVVGRRDVEHGQAGLGPYQLQAAIAAIHDEAPRAEDTDWAQILGVYDLLAGTGDNPVVTLNHAVALAMVRGPEAGLAMLDIAAAR